MDPYTDEGETEDVILHEKRESRRRRVIEGNDGWLDNQKTILHTKMWDVYMSDYYVEVSSSDGNNVILEVVDDHVV